ncbi:CAAX prenyl protease 2-like [Bidens hawaiensis]|uniref:CAAX prenyl protease 2-like n=1 Tax=Bidens hawaiensis TaxID=980011 RepID=UPI0040498870
MEVLYTTKGVIVCQRKFVKDMLLEFDTSNIAIHNSPLPRHMQLKAHERLALDEPLRYRKLVINPRSGDTHLTTDSVNNRGRRRRRIVTCIGMTVLYVAILYSPTLILRLPPPSSFKTFMIRRFICAAISTVVSLIVCAFILPIKRWSMAHLVSAYGIRLHHTWEAVVFSLGLTSLMYTGSFILKILTIWSSWAERADCQIDISFHGLKSALQNLSNWMLSLVYNISVWRMYIVAPLTEELVFRACMISLLLCGGFKPYSVILLSPVLFSLAHLNHLLEFYMQQDTSLPRASMVVGFQLGYTVIFGSYASFLFVRTGHIAAPLVSHMFCNIMGLPAFFSRRTWLVSVGFVAGTISFVYLLFPLTSPALFNDRTDDCKCWHTYCYWT